VTLVSESVAEVAPLIGEPFLVQLQVGVGLPVAAAVSVTLAPSVTVWEDGSRVMTGAAGLLKRCCAGMRLSTPVDGLVGSNGGQSSEPKNDGLELRK